MKVNSTNPVGTSDAERLQKAVAGYQVAAQRLDVHTSMIWSVFQAMTVAHSVLIALHGILPRAECESGRSQRISDFLPLVGFLLCLIWAVINWRSFRYQNFYLEEAKDLEKHLAPIVKTLKAGENAFAPAFKYIKTEFMVYAVVIVFTGLYVYLYFSP